MYFFLRPIFTILDSHSSRSAFKVAEAPSLLSLEIFYSGMILNSIVSTSTLWQTWEDFLPYSLQS